MGSFMGHFIPGVFFIAMSLWWTFASLTRYYRSLQHKNKRYRTSACFNCQGCGRQLPIESCLKILFVIMGIIGETTTGMEHGVFKYIGNAQHATMYGLFGFSGIIDLLLFFGCRLPQNIDYCWGIVAFICEALLFEFHLHLHDPLAVAMHKMLFYAVLGTILALVLEMKWPHNVLGTLGRAYCVLLQGTWFLQLGVDLYLPSHTSQPSMDMMTTPKMPSGGPGDMEAFMNHHRAVELAAIKFSLHMFGIFAFMLTAAGAVSCWIRPHPNVDIDFEILRHRGEQPTGPKAALLSASDEEEF